MEEGQTGGVSEERPPLARIFSGSGNSGLIGYQGMTPEALFRLRPDPLGKRLGHLVPRTRWRSVSRLRLEIVVAQARLRASRRGYVADWETLRARNNRRAAVGLDFTPDRRWGWARWLITVEANPVADAGSRPGCGRSPGEM